MPPEEPAVKPKRAYRSAVRRDRARANRRAILVAARDSFLANGYPRTAIASVAEQAGVSEDLVYKLFENKRGLLIEVLNFVVTGEVDSPPVLNQEGPRAVREEPDQRRQLAMFAHDIAGRVSRARPVDDVLRSAAAVDPELGAKRAQEQETRWRNLCAFVGWIAGNGPLRDGLDEDTAATTVWALTSAEVHSMLVDVRGWDHQRYAGWLHEVLVRLLLPDD